MDVEKNLELINKVELIVPNTNGLSEAETTYALNTVAAFNELLMYLGDEDLNHIFALSELMTNCIESQILESDDQITYDEVDNHPLLIYEFNHQQEVIKNYA